MNGVHCFSRAFMRLSYKRPDPSPYVFGGVAGRRREEAVGAALNIQARCLRAGKSYLFKLRDVRGAFTNVTHESVRQHLEATQRSPEAAIHHNQHLNTVLRTPGGGDWRITKGTRQGDFGCDMFLGVYDIPLKKYVKCVVVPVSAEVFFEDVQGSNLHQCSECKARFSTRVGMFLHRTKVHGYKSPQVVYFKGNTCPRCKSLFATEKSANDHYRRNLKRKFCAKPRGPDASNVPPRRVAQSPPKNRGKRGKGLLTQQTLFGVFGFEAQGDRGQKRGLACSGRGAGARGGRGAGSKS